MARTILFLSPKCALDDRSGAARSVRNILTSLAGAGWAAQSVTMTLFDGASEYPLARVVGDAAASPENHGRFLEVARDGVRHRMFRTASTVDGRATEREAAAFYQGAAEILAAERPDVVLLYGSSALSRRLINLAGEVAGSLVFYLANPGYDDAALFRPMDRVLVPSEFLAATYRQRLGLDPRVLPDPIRADEAPAPEDVLAVAEPARRRFGFVTLMNPFPPKGGTLFWRMAEMAGRERPDLLFLAVEGRMPAEAWTRAGFDLAERANVWWLPNQPDVRPILARTSVLLFPSFWDEPSGRGVAEAQLAGIPVLGANHGGIPEQLNGGGFALDVPARCRFDSHRHVPTEAEARPWLDTVHGLMDDEAFYRDAIRRALAAAEPFRPEQSAARIAACFEGLPVPASPRPTVPETPAASGTADTAAPAPSAPNLLDPGPTALDARPRFEAPAPPPARERADPSAASARKKPGRNAPCPCGSGRKHKHCCA